MKIEMLTNSFEWVKTRRQAFGVAIAATSLFLTGCTVSASNNPSVATSEPAPSSPPVPSDGCELLVFAQNVWPANPDEVAKNNATPIYGASVRSGPGAQYERIGGVKANDPIETDGWRMVADGKPLYPNNPPDRDGSIWLRVVGEGWVNNAAVRAQRTTPDPELGLGEDTSLAVADEQRKTDHTDVLNPNCQTR